VQRDLAANGTHASVGQHEARLQCNHVWDKHTGPVLAPNVRCYCWPLNVPVRAGIGCAPTVVFGVG